MQVVYQLDGKDTKGKMIKVLIGDDVYHGDITYLPLCSLQFVRERGDGGILATSVKIKALSLVNGDCDKLYVTDDHRYSVELYVESQLIWKGYLIREIKTNPYKDSPFEVDIQAVDGIGLLKEVKYWPQYNRIPLWGVVTWLTTRINPAMDVVSLTKLYEAGEGVGSGSFLEKCYINDALFKDMNAYEILATITENLSAYYTQVNGYYIFWREDCETNAGLSPNEILTTGATYIPVQVGIIGSVTKDPEFIPQASLSESVMPARRNMPVTIKTNPVSALGEPFMPDAYKTWSGENTPIVVPQKIDGQRQLFFSHGTFSKVFTNLKAPGYPMKLRIAGATLGEGKLHVVMYAGDILSGWYHDFSEDSDKKNRWTQHIGGWVTHKLDIPGELALKDNVADDVNLTYGDYRVAKSSVIELEVDAFPPGLIQLNSVVGVVLYVDKDDEFYPNTRLLTENGVWIESVELITEAFEDQEKVVVVNEGVITDAEGVTLLVRESPDDNGSQLFLPGVITDVNGDPLHLFTRSSKNVVTARFNDLLMYEKAAQYKYARKVLKGSILGEKGYSTIYFAHMGDSALFIADKLSCDLLTCMSQVTLIEKKIPFISANDYNVYDADDIVEIYDSIQEKEYRLKVDCEDIPPSGGEANITVMLERYEWGVLVSRYPVSATFSKSSKADYVEIDGNSVNFSPQPLVVGEDRACTLQAEYHTDFTSVTKIFTIRQTANSYGLLNTTLTAGPDLIMSSPHVYKFGGSISFDYQSYRFAEQRKWASGDIETVEVLANAKIELVDAWSGVKLLESGGVCMGVEVNSIASTYRSFKVRFTDWLTRSHVYDYTITQLTTTVDVNVDRVVLYNNKEGKGFSSEKIDNITNKGKLVVIPDPLNAYPEIQSFSIVFGLNLATIDSEGVITVLPTAGINSYCIVRYTYGNVTADYRVFITYNQ